MNEHMRVGHDYPTIRQALAYSFGLDSQDFVVAYETDDLRRVRRPRPRAALDREPAVDRQRHADPARDPSADRRDPRPAGGRVMARRRRPGSRTRRLHRAGRGPLPGRRQQPGPRLPVGRASAAHPRARRGRRTSGTRTAGATSTTSARWGPAILGHAHPAVTRRDHRRGRQTAWPSARPTRRDRAGRGDPGARCPRWSACGSPRRAPRR